MNVLDLVLQLAVKYGPDVVLAVESVVAEIKKNHPDLVAPPPPDEEIVIDHEP